MSSLGQGAPGDHGDPPFRAHGVRRESLDRVLQRALRPRAPVGRVDRDYVERITGVEGHTYGSSTCADTASRSSCWSTSDHAATGAPAHCPTPEAPTCASRATIWMRTSRACRRPASSSARCRSRRPAARTGAAAGSTSEDRTAMQWRSCRWPPERREPRFQQQVVLVTGAAGGLGLVLCRAFADEGLVSCSPSLQDRAPRGGRGRGARRDGGGRGRHRRGEVRRLVDATVASHGTVDVLVAAAGLYQGTGSTRSSPGRGITCMRST